MKIEINIECVEKIQKNIDAIKEVINMPQISMVNTMLLIDVQYILIAIKEAAEAKGA